MADNRSSDSPHRRETSQHSSYPDVTKHYELTEEECSIQVSDCHLELISQSYCRLWRMLPAHLELKSIVAEDIEYIHGDEREKRYKFLLQWKEIKGSLATYKQLINALLKIDCMGDADAVCTSMLKESISTQTKGSISGPISSTGIMLYIEYLNKARPTDNNFM